MLMHPVGYLNDRQEFSFHQEFNQIITTQLKIVSNEPLMLKSGKIVGTSIPAKLVGGDYYDICPLLDGKVRIVIGDVMGKGMAAAMLSILTKGAFRVAAEYTKNPGETLSLINQSLFKDLRKMRSFVTLFCADWNPVTGEFTYASAGHQTPVIIGKEAIKPCPNVSGTMVGGLPRQVYKEGTVFLEKGDSVFFFTDGIIEARNKNGEHFDLTRLIDSILEAKKKDMQDMDQYVLQSVNKFTEGVLQRDDITMVLLKVSNQ